MDTSLDTNIGEEVAGIPYSTHEKVSGAGAARKKRNVPGAVQGVLLRYQPCSTFVAC